MPGALWSLLSAIHDGIIVPASAADQTKALLLDAGDRIAEVRLRVTVDVAPHRELADAMSTGA
jgi:hypothetical protein